MRKNELIKIVSDKTGIEYVVAQAAIEQAFIEIRREITAGGKVTINGFGRFWAVIHKAKAAQIINQQDHSTQTIRLPDRRRPKFRPGDWLFDYVERYYGLSAKEQVELKIAEEQEDIFD